MKRLVSLAFCLLFLFNYLGYFFSYFVAEHYNRMAIQEDLPDENNLEVIRVHRSESGKMIFKDGGREIVMNGEYYDVKYAETDGEFLIFHCKHDKNETSLFSGLRAHVKSHGGSNNGEKKDGTSYDPVKDLFLDSSDLIADVFSGTDFATAVIDFISFIPPALPHPPPNGLLA